MHLCEGRCWSDRVKQDIQDKRFYQPLHRCSLREEWLVQVWSTFYNNLGQDFVYCCYSPSISFIGSSWRQYLLYFYCVLCIYWIFILIANNLLIQFLISVTGHADGSVRFWDASSNCMQALSRVRTQKLFEKVIAGINFTFLNILDFHFCLISIP